MIDVVPFNPGNLLEFRGLVLGAKVSLDSRGAPGSQDNQAFGEPVLGKREEHRQHVSSGILRKQSWIRGLDTTAPGENLVPNRQAASFPQPPLCP